MLFFKRFSVGIRDVAKSPNSYYKSQITAKVIHISYVDYVKYEHISLRRWNYSNYAPNNNNKILYSYKKSYNYCNLQ